MKKDVFSLVTSSKNPIYIFLDTNFLIDAVRNPHKFKDIIAKLLENKLVSFVTLDSVLIEYYKGSNNQEDLKKKVEALLPLNLDIIPIDKTIVTNATELAIIYQQNGKAVSTTDYYLGGALMKYSKSNAYMLSRDHGDFPQTIFDKVAYLVVDYDRNVQTFVLYSFNERKYRSKAKKILVT